MNHALSITHDGTLKIVLPKGYEVNKVIVKSGKEMMEFSAVLRCKDCKWWTKQEMFCRADVPYTACIQLVNGIVEMLGGRTDE